MFFASVPLLRTISCLLASLIFSTLCLASTYYVATDGHDQNPGTQNAPFGSVQYGVNQLQPGDTLVIGSGIYRETVTIRNFGTHERLTTIRAEKPGSVIFNASNLTRHKADIRKFDQRYNSRPHYVIAVINSHGIKIEGLSIGSRDRQISGSRGFGIMVGGDLSTTKIGQKSIHITGNKVYGTGMSGIFASNTNGLRITGNEIARAVQIGFQECLTVSNSTNFEIAYNLVHDRPKTDNNKTVYSLFRDYIIEESFLFNGSGPRNPNGIIGEIETPGGEGIDAKGKLSNGVMHNNIIDGIEGKLGAYVDAWDKKAENIDIHNNITLNSGCGFALSAENGHIDEQGVQRGLLKGVELQNNISFNNECGLYMGYHGGYSDGAIFRPVRDINIRNNLFIGNKRAGISIQNPDITRVRINDNIVTTNGATHQVRIGAALLPKVEKGSISFNRNLIHGEFSTDIARSGHGNRFTGKMYFNFPDGERRNIPGYNNAGLIYGGEALIQRLQNYLTGDKYSWMTP